MKELLAICVLHPWQLVAAGGVAAPINIGRSYSSKHVLATLSMFSFRFLGSNSCFRSRLNYGGDLVRMEVNTLSSASFLITLLEIPFYGISHLANIHILITTIPSP
jgi:hypothetical protein